jgi:hypothetical protein
MISQKAQDNTDKISCIKKTIEILGVEFPESSIIIVGEHHLVVRESCLSGIDIKEISHHGPGHMIGDIVVSSTTVNAVIQCIPAGVHAHKARARGTPGSAVKKDKKGLVFAPFIRGMKAVPNTRLGRLQIQSRKITPVMEIEWYGLDVDKPGFVLDGQVFQTVEKAGV